MKAHKKHVLGKINSLPLELESNILSRLPLKLLYHLKCISKHWRNLISSQHFLKLHRQHHANGDSEGTVILVGWINGIFSYDFNADILKDLTNVGGSDHSHLTRLVGSCNGLLCFEKSSIISLYNPATGAYKKITRVVKRYPGHSTTMIQKDGCTTYLAAQLRGFGYDRFSDDYKVLLIHSTWRFRDGECPTSDVEEEGAYIYSFKAESWKVLQNDRMYRELRTRVNKSRSNKYETMALTNNALSWLIKSSSKKECHKCVVASFDLRLEEYTEMPVPVGINTNNNSSESRLSVLKNCLHIIHATRDLSRMDVWVMKEYGVEQSWTKNFQCSLIDQLNKELSGIACRGPIPCAYSEDGQEMLVALNARPEVFVRCNLQRQQVSIVPISLDQKYRRHGCRTLSWSGVLDSPIDN